MKFAINFKCSLKRKEKVKDQLNSCSKVFLRPENYVYHEKFQLLNSSSLYLECSQNLG